VALREHAGPLAERHLADIPLLVAGRAVEDFRCWQDLEIDVEAFGGHAARDEIAHVVVVADGQRDRKPGHDQDCTIAGGSKAAMAGSGCSHRSTSTNAVCEIGP